MTYGRYIVTSSVSIKIKEIKHKKKILEENAQKIIDNDGQCSDILCEECFLEFECIYSKGYLNYIEKIIAIDKYIKKVKENTEENKACCKCMGLRICGQPTCDFDKALQQALDNLKE